MPAAGAVLLAVCAALAIGAPERLAAGSLALDGDREPALVVETAGGPAAAPGSRVYEVALDVIGARLRSDPDVAKVVRRGATLQVTLRDAAGDEQLEAVRRIEGNIDPGPLRVTVAGEIAELDAARRRIGADLWRLELLALPLVALMVFWTLGLAPGLAAIAAAALAVCGPAAVLRLLAGPLDPSLLALAAAAPVGVGLALARAGRPGPHGEGLLPPDAWSVAAAGAAPLALLATPLDQAPSLALGCALAAAFAALGSRLFGEWPAQQDRGREAVRSRWTPPRGVIAAGVLGGVAAVAAAVALCLDLETVGLAAPEGGSLAPDLPRAAVALALVGAVLLGLAARSPWAAPLGLLPLAPAAVGLGAATLVLQGDSAPLGLEAVIALETGAVAAGAAAVGALALAGAVAVLRPAAGWSALGTVAVVAAAGVLLAADEPSAQQFGLIVAAGAAAEALLSRPAVALARSRLARRLPSATAGG